MHQHIFIVGTVHLVFHDENGYRLLVSTKRQYEDEKKEIHEEEAKIEVHVDDKRAGRSGQYLKMDARVYVRGYVRGTDKGNPIIIPANGTQPAYSRMNVEANTVKVVGQATDHDEDDIVWLMVGRLGRDPEMRYMPEGDNQVTNFSLAVDNFPAKDVKEVIWVRCAAWGNNAIQANNLSTGKSVLIETRPLFKDGLWRLWTRNNGEPGASFEATVMRLRFLERREADTDSTPMQQEIDSGEPLW